MNEFLNNNKRLIMIAGLAVLVAVVGSVIYYGSPRNAKRALFNNEHLVKEVPTARTIEHVSIVDGGFAVSTGEQIALVSDTHVVIEGGKTIKDGYALAQPTAIAWATDAKLVYIRSLGTVTVEGVSSGWEIVFGSRSKNKGYMIAVIDGVVGDTKEITSASSGYSLPNNWYDSGEAIKSIQTLPQFKDATISGLNFYYSEDGKRWGYALVSSRGVLAIPVR